ncbi:MAG: ABC transporter substrate-binding protein [Gammaproteobacteria bacterium]|nr:ABC transporter substrate-binding protein [Gammaproteobacteria bacterium]
MLKGDLPPPSDPDCLTAVRPYNRALVNIEPHYVLHTRQPALSRVRLAIACLFLIAAPSLTAHGASPDQSDEIVVAFAVEPNRVDPTVSIGGLNERFITLFYEQLANVDPERNRVNWLAESWSQSTRGSDHVVSIKLREGVKFHNGDTLTSHDFRYAFERQRSAASPAAYRLRYARDLVVHDDHRFDIVFERPDALFFHWNLALWAVPRRYYEEVGDAGVQAHPIGTGPWKFVSRKAREELVVERFEDYWNGGTERRAKRLVIKIIPEDTTRLAAFRTGRADWIDALPTALVEEFRSMPGVRVASLPTPNNLYLGMNAIDPASPLSDVRVRRAVAHAIDVDAIVEHVVNGQAIRTAQVAPGSLGYDPSLAPYPYDPARARALLAEAGYPRGFDINCYNMTTPREANIKEVGEAAYAFLGAVGIRCRIVQLEYGAWADVLRRRTRPDMDGIISAMGEQGLPGDPISAWSLHLHSWSETRGSVSYHADARFDRLLETARTTLDPTERQTLVREIARKKHEELAGGLPTYRPLTAFAWRDTIDFRPWPAGHWRSMQEIRRAAR